MPELPDVESFKRTAAKCVGRTVHRVSVGDPRMLKGTTATTVQRRLTGGRVSSVSRYGKHLFLNFARAGAVEMHFGMNGSLRLVKEKEADPAYARFMLFLDRGDRLAYLNPRRIGDVMLVTDVASFVAESQLGPDALDRRLTLDAFRQLLAERKRDVKSVLMDQSCLAGIGNIYSDEILFQARIHPAARADTLPPDHVHRLFKSMKHVLKTAVARRAGSEDAMERLPRGFLLRERHRGGHCPRCGTVLATVKRAGRTSYNCPRCQKA
ncbi:MAG TPA: DNA-formamidopyrimidine glycosylase family protein [Stellaceae bacterium]|nr:DNA-formamidopyrimidine glycosylase family protein [Stellaceae bacterium]